MTASSISSSRQSVSRHTLDEFAVIERFFTPPGSVSASVVVGVGDDCALLDVPDDCHLALSIDTLVEGVHFFTDSPAEALGQRALRVALSDLAAMGASPLCCTLAISLPAIDESWLEAFSRGFLSACSEMACPLVGGDTTRGALTITVQVHGAVRKGNALRRHGARVGDNIWVSGYLGSAAAALEVLPDQTSCHYSHFYHSYYQPTPQVELGKGLVGVASACIDISDGFLQDLNHICRQSHVGASLRSDKLPLHAALVECVGNDRARALALGGGDDYQLLFTASPAQAENIKRLGETLKASLTHVGDIVSSKQIVDEITGQALKTRGYRHFGRNT